jgi:ABC-type tungstate transport system permease subunit
MKKLLLILALGITGCGDAYNEQVLSDVATATSTDKTTLLNKLKLDAETNKTSIDAELFRVCERLKARAGKAPESCDTLNPQ